MVFLFDVDNTLLNNDRITRDIHSFLKREVGTRRAQAYWRIFEKQRENLGYADYLGALQKYRLKYPHDLHLLQLARFLLDYPFAKRLCRKSLEAIKHVSRWGTAAILSDGDVVFQPHKIEASGLLKAVHGHALVYVHKERELRDVQHRLPARRYVLFDDKVRVLTAIKRKWRNRVVTVFVRQGHYALDRKLVAKFPPADLSVRCIADVLRLRESDFRPR